MRLDLEKPELVRCCASATVVKWLGEALALASAPKINRARLKETLKAAFELARELDDAAHEDRETEEWGN